MSGPDWTGMAIVGVPLALVSLGVWLSLRRDARRAQVAKARRRHPSSQGRHERLSKCERLEFEPQFRRIAAAERLAEVLDAVMAEREAER
jgi:hypothetical protein